MTSPFVIDAGQPRPAGRLEHGWSESREGETTLAELVDRFGVTSVAYDANGHVLYVVDSSESEVANAIPPDANRTFGPVAHHASHAPGIIAFVVSFASTGLLLGWLLFQVLKALGKSYS
jgi:hypothetical protein